MLADQEGMNYIFTFNLNQLRSILTVLDVYWVRPYTFFWNNFNLKSLLIQITFATLYKCASRKNLSEKASEETGSDTVSLNWNIGNLNRLNFADVLFKDQLQNLTNH